MIVKLAVHPPLGLQVTKRALGESAQLVRKIDKALRK
jgi:hypothetical protein